VHEDLALHEVEVLFARLLTAGLVSLRKLFAGRSDLARRFWLRSRGLGLRRTLPKQNGECGDQPKASLHEIGLQQETSISSTDNHTVPPPSSVRQMNLSRAHG
jgi:hypothetical protein